MRVTFQLRILPSNYGIGDHPVKMEMVVGLQLGSKPPITFRHFLLNLGTKSSTTMELPNQVALRLQDFCQQHYVDGKDNFDCQSLLFHVMNWQHGAIPVRKNVNIRHSVYQAKALQSGKPYAIFKESMPHFPHYMLGIPRPGYSLGVGGHNQPLLIARNVDLLKTYNGTDIVAIHKVG